jgi:hypothetical protein
VQPIAGIAQNSVLRTGGGGRAGDGLHGKVNLPRGMEPSPGAGSGSNGEKAGVWMGEGVELHGPAEQVGGVGIYY